jgi:hypothetical protein
MEDGENRESVDGRWREELRDGRDRKMRAEGGKKKGRRDVEAQGRPRPQGHKATRHQQGINTRGEIKRDRKLICNSSILQFVHCICYSIIHTAQLRTWIPAVIGAGNVTCS